jgi:hypothetical protein
MRISWLVHTVESKACLREYNMVCFWWCMCSCNCTWIFIGNLNTLNKIKSLQCLNNWEPNIFNEQHQYTILSLLGHPAVWSAGPQLTCLCYLQFLPTATSNRQVYLLFYDLHNPSVSSSLGHGVLATVNLSLPHTTSILLTRTKVYGYKDHAKLWWLTLRYEALFSLRWNQTLQLCTVL